MHFDRIRIVRLVEMMRTVFFRFRIFSARLRLLAVVALLSSSLNYLHSQTRHTGEIEGALFIVDVPAQPSGDVMFIARGYRPEFFPLSAVYEFDTGFYQTLLSEGWTIASTSFRTNEWVVVDGALDVLALREHIDQRIHPIERSFLYGETMGAGVAIWLAENHSETFAGVFGLGAHLFPESVPNSDQRDALADVFSGDPGIPVLLAANVGEVGSSLEYREVSSRSKKPAQVWIVGRAGHVNLNSQERLAAMRALVKWAEGEEVESRSDARIEMSPVSTAAHFEGYAAGNIRGIRPLYGNVYTTFVADDLKRLSVELGDSFTVTHKSQSYRVTFAEAYSDVAVGEWVAFMDPEGYLQVSRNYANAAETLEAIASDPLLISRAD